MRVVEQAGFEMQRVLLVRHAESIPPGPEFLDEFTRPLSTVGHRQARELCIELERWQPTGLWSSPYLRAVQTLEPFAQLRGMTLGIEPEFREHRMAEEPIENWQEVLAHQWTDFDYAPPGGESFRDSQRRGIAVVRSLLGRSHGTVALAGHGTTISLVLHSLRPSFGFREHLQMPNPALFALDWDGETLSWCERAL